jgi:hypothetical protein
MVTTQNDRRDIKFPHTALATCKASLCLSSFEYFASEKYKNDILLFLASCHFLYQKLALESLKPIFGDNPWGYQPVKNFTIENYRFFDNEHPEEFISYLKGFNILYDRKVTNKDDTSFDIIKVIRENTTKKKVIIVDINEFYNPKSRFYNKNANLHTLLITNVKQSEPYFEVIDTEFTRFYDLTSDDMRKSYNFSYTTLECQNFKRNVDINLTLQQLLSNYQSNDYLKNLIEDVKDSLNSARTEFEVDYYMRGFHFCNAYRIIPVIKMRKYLFEILSSTDKKCKEIAEKSNLLQEKWESLSRFLFRLIELKQKDVTALLEKYNTIHELEESLLSQINEKYKA